MEPLLDVCLSAIRISGSSQDPDKGPRELITDRSDFLLLITLSKHTAAQVKMPIQKVTKLNTGAIMPLVGLGTLFCIWFR
jgi:hypothetical protein